MFPGVAVHIIQRGNNRAACFAAESDYLTYLATLRVLARRHECKVHAYCLMTNHVHLLVTPATDEACGLLMRDLGRTYVGYFNRRHARTGTLWEGRFRSSLTESAEYVLACYRYIEMNPVRAGMVARPGEYPWSSYAANSGMRSDSLVGAHCEYTALAFGNVARYCAYRGLFSAALEDRLVQAIRNAANGGYPLVSEFLRSRLEVDGVRVERASPGPRARSLQ